MVALEHLISFARSNQVLAGVAAAGGFASVLYWLREIPARLLRLAVWSVSTQLDIANDSAAYEPFLAWLEAAAKGWHTRLFKLSTHGRHVRRADGTEDDWLMAPGFGRHLVWHRGRPCLVWRWRSDSKDSQRFRPRETIRIRMPGFSRRRIELLVEEVKAASRSPSRLSISVWLQGYWQEVRSCDVRGLDTIVLGPGLKERMVEDLARFRAARQWYRERGLPWRRGYLFAGPPGTGKSSLAMALAGRFGMPVAALNLGSIGGDGTLIEAVSEVGPGTLLLIEDIDTVRVTASRAAEGQEGEQKGITLGGLLNVLDGALSQEGRVMIMTTNHAERIDPALLRPGRVDLRFDFPKAGPTEIAAMYARFFAGRSLEVPATLAMAPAEVQGICLQYAGDPEGAARRLVGGGVHAVGTSAAA